MNILEMFGFGKKKDEGTPAQTTPQVPSGDIPHLSQPTGTMSGVEVGMNQQMMAKSIQETMGNTAPTPAATPAETASVAAATAAPEQKAA